MIFIGLFLFIAFIVIALNMHNQSNLDKIEEYLHKSNCQKIIYSKGSYKGLCENYLIELKNSFTVDIDKNSKTIDYKEIKTFEVKDLTIVINNDFKIEFNDKKDLNTFYEQLGNKLKN